MAPRGTRPAGRKRTSKVPPNTQLPSGRHGLSPEYVAENQRERIMDALARTVSDVGYPAATITAITATAGLSRVTFYTHFPNKEEAYLRTYDVASEHLYGRVAASFMRARNDPGARQLRDCLETFLNMLAARPQLAHMCVVDVLSAGPLALQRRNQTMRDYADLFDQAAAAAGQPLTPLAAQGLVGAVYEVVYSRILDGQAAELPGLLDELHEFCLVPFVAGGRSPGSSASRKTSSKDR